MFSSDFASINPVRDYIFVEANTTNTDKSRRDDILDSLINALFENKSLPFLPNQSSKTVLQYKTICVSLVTNEHEVIYAPDS